MAPATFAVAESDFNGQRGVPAEQGGRVNGLARVINTEAGIELFQCACLGVRQPALAAHEAAHRAVVSRPVAGLSGV